METALDIILKILAIWGLGLLYVVGFAVAVWCAANVRERGCPRWVAVIVGTLALFCWPLVLLVWLAVRPARAIQMVAVVRKA